MASRGFHNKWILAENEMESKKQTELVNLLIRAQGAFLPELEIVFLRAEGALLLS